MNPEEDNIDTLQLPEESDPEWVNLWDDCRSKKEPSTKQNQKSRLSKNKTMQYSVRFK